MLIIPINNKSCQLKQLISILKFEIIKFADTNINFVQIVMTNDWVAIVLDKSAQTYFW